MFEEFLVHVANMSSIGGGGGGGSAPANQIASNSSNWYDIQRGFVRQE